jgi:5-formyltetrahydrofolate cyclo-ligase
VHARAVRAAQPPALAAAVAAHLRRHVQVPPGGAVAGVWPRADEMDLRPLWHALHAAGARVLLPQTPARGHPLIFRLWQPGCAMLPERFGTYCPDGPELAPDLILVPLLAFDSTGHRLGYGGGFYDRTLAAHPAVPAIGFAYAAQHVPAVPTEPHDRLLCTIITEHGAFPLAPPAGPL